VTGTLDGRGHTLDVDGLGRAIGDGITGLIAGAFDAIGGALRGIIGAGNQALPGGLFWALMFVLVVVVGWSLAKR
jgi:hypothetical protein